MIEFRTLTETVESDTPLVFHAYSENAHVGEEPPTPAWTGWFSPDDDRDGGHSDR